MAMFIQMFMPLSGLVCTFGYNKAMQLYDSKGTCDPYVTRQNTMFWYKAYNGSAEYLMHFKYSDSLNVIFVTLMYGLTMPMLFPIAAITLKLQNICEKITVAWAAR